MSDSKETPKHIAIIMDGNGRWATERNETRLFGHINGVKSVREAVKGAIRCGVKYLTIYAFSSENWGRPQEEVSGLMALFISTIGEEIEELIAQGVRLRFSGRTDRLDSDVRESLLAAEEMTKNNSVLELIIALDYGGREELLLAFRSLANKVEKGEIAPSEIDEDMVTQNLYITDVPFPDLLIRTSGEQRISNFMLWQLAYSEFYFMEKYWPDFVEADMVKAIDSYCRRDRRFGLVK